MFLISGVLGSLSSASKQPSGDADSSRLDTVYWQLGLRVYLEGHTVDEINPALP